MITHKTKWLLVGLVCLAHVLVRARIGRRVADALARIANLENDIIATPARTPAEAAVRRRHLAALSRAGIIP